MARTLAHYEVFEQLGAGGMGAVFRARDTRLGRDVALKLLPATLFADQDARRRLEQEARLASSLNHPNICTIYEVGESGDETYVAMELVGGGPLSAKIPPGGLPPETVLRYGTEIADALAHAHEHGVLHRDLKAANIAITADGRTKVLDFGLARRTASQPGDATRTVTQPGTITGTPSHLAPELLRGGTADERSDLWALAVVLYEMAAGRLPFEGRTEYERTSSILNDPPAPLPERVPPGLRAVILRGLEKDAAHRYPRASEVRAALEALSSDLHAPVGSPRPPRAATPPPTWQLAVGVLVIALAAALAWIALKRPWVHREMQQRQLTTYPPEEYGFGTISPDGKTLAVADLKGLSLRAIDSGESHPLALPAGLSLGGQVMPLLTWSTDGSRLLVSGQTADGVPCEWSLPILGGSPREIVHNGHLATMSRDGSKLAWVRAGPEGGEIWCSGPNGEDPRRIAASDSSGVIPFYAVWSPSADRLAYCRALIDATGPHISIETSDLLGHRRTIFSDSAAQGLHFFTVPAWLPDGRMLFGLTDPPPNQADLNLWSLHVDPRSGVPSGKPQRITQWQNLSVVFPTASSLDGKRLSVTVLHYQSDCYIGRIAGGDSLLDPVTRLTRDDRMDVLPSWTSDSRAILFVSDRNGNPDLFEQALDADEAKALASGPGAQGQAVVSPDGAWFLYMESDAGSAPGAPSATRLMRMATAGGAPEKVFDTQPAAGFACARAPANLCVLSEVDKGQTVFSSFDPVKGRLKELARTNPTFIWDLSPDGTRIARLTQPDTTAVIRILSLVGGAETSVRLDRAVVAQQLAWAADGRSFYVVAVARDRAWLLLHVGPDGHTASLIPPQLWMYSAAASPDGRKLAYTSNTGQGNVWLLEGF